MIDILTESVLSSLERERYSRQLLLPEFGEDGQLHLKKGHVLIVGAGGLGSYAALCLAAAGIGTLGIADGDRVELSNLQRQLLHTEADLGRLKTESAAEKLSARNSSMQLQTYPCMLDSQSLGRFLPDYDFVLDCTGTLAAKYMVNDVCIGAGMPFCYGGIWGFHGQLMTVLPRKTPCFRCVFGPEPEDLAARAAQSVPAIGPVVGVIGMLQAMEAIKYLTGCGELLAGYMLKCNLLTGEFRRVSLPARRDGCSACGGKS